MKHIIIFRAALLCILVAIGVSLSGAYAQPRAQEQEHAVYLPLVIGSAASGPGNPIPVRFVDDSGRAAHAAIGPQGGTLSATAADGTRFELSVPAEALDFSETITMTLVLRAENLPLSGGLIGAVSLEPAGLAFYEPATLRIIPATLAPGYQTIGFAYNGSGEQFHLRPLAPIPGAVQLQAAEIAITMEIISIRPYGVGRGSQADIDRQLQQPAPSDPMDALDQSMLDKLRQISALGETYDRVVEPNLQRAKTDVSVTDQALRQIDQWWHLVEMYGLMPRFDNQIAHAKALLGDVLEHAASISADRCYTQKRPEEGFRLLRWVRYAKKYLPGAPLIAEFEAKLAKCLKFELTFHSTITETGSGYGYYYELRANTTLRAAQSTRATGSGPLDWIDFHWTAGGICQFSTQGESSTFDTSSAGFGLSMVPISRTSPAVKLTLRYNPGVPYENTTMSCPGANPISWHTHAWSTYFTEMHEYEREGSAMQAKVQVVNAGSFTGWVYHHTTTGPSGQAVVEDTQIEIAHAPER